MSIPEEWAKDWDNPEDAVYDKEQRMREYMELSQQLEDDLIAEMGQEEYDASQHWINNPLIKPRSKVAIFEEWLERTRKETVDEIVETIEADRSESHAIDDLFDGVVFQTLSRSEFKAKLITFIEGTTDAKDSSL